MEHGMTQAEIGRIAGLTNKAVSNWEHDRFSPRMGNVRKVAEYFNVPISALVDDENTECDEENEDEDEDDIMEYREAVRRNPDLRVLFKLTNNASTEDVKKAIAIVKMLKGEDEE
jgi:transcriptional regulator with XRE-family HTH domain